MSVSSKKTKDHEEIKRWAEERGGKPAIVEGTEDTGKGAGLLRIEFKQGKAGHLEETNWDTFFEVFDERNLTFLYQDKTMDGKTSRFFKFITEK